MGAYSMVIKIDEEELNKIFEELENAQETIWKCYSRLKELGVVEFCKKEAVSGN